VSHHERSTHAVATTLRDALESAGDKASELLNAADLGKLSAAGHDVASEMRAQVSSLPANDTVRRVKRRGARRVQRVAEAMGDQARRVDSTTEPKRRWRKTVMLLLVVAGGGVAIRRALTKRGADPMPYASIDEPTQRTAVRPDPAPSERINDSATDDVPVAHLPHTNGRSATASVNGGSDQPASDQVPKKRSPARKPAGRPDQ
jgi:hypothetical protein